MRVIGPKVVRLGRGGIAEIGGVGGEQCGRVRGGGESGGFDDFTSCCVAHLVLTECESIRVVLETRGGVGCLVLFQSAPQLGRMVLAARALEHLRSAVFDWRNMCVGDT